MKYKQVHSNGLSNNRLDRANKRFISHSKRLMGVGSERMLERCQIINRRSQNNASGIIKLKSNASFIQPTSGIKKKNNSRRVVSIKKKITRSAPANFRIHQIMNNATFTSESLSATQLQLPQIPSIIVHSSAPNEVKSNVPIIKESVNDCDDVAMRQVKHSLTNILDNPLITNKNILNKRSSNSFISKKNLTSKISTPKYKSAQTPRMIKAITQPVKVKRTSRTHINIIPPSKIIRNSMLTPNSPCHMTRSRSMCKQTNNVVKRITRQRSAVTQPIKNSFSKRLTKNSKPNKAPINRRITRNATKNKVASISRKQQKNTIDNISVSKYIHDKISKTNVNKKSNEKVIRNITQKINKPLSRSAHIMNLRNKSAPSTPRVNERKYTALRKKTSRNVPDYARLKTLRPRSAPTLVKKNPIRRITPARQKAIKTSLARYHSLPKNRNTSIIKNIPKIPNLQQSHTISVKRNVCKGNSINMCGTKQTTNIRGNCRQISVDNKEYNDEQVMDVATKGVKRHTSKVNKQSVIKKSRRKSPVVNQVQQNDADDNDHNRSAINKKSSKTLKLIKPIVIKNEAKTEIIHIHKDSPRGTIKIQKLEPRNIKNTKVNKSVADKRKIKIKVSKNLENRSSNESLDDDSEYNCKVSDGMRKKWEKEPILTTERLSDFVLDWLYSIPSVPEITPDMLNYYTES